VTVDVTLRHVAGPRCVVVPGSKKAIQFWCANCISEQSWNSTVSAARERQIIYPCETSQNLNEGHNYSKVTMLHQVA